MLQITTGLFRFRTLNYDVRDLAFGTNLGGFEFVFDVHSVAESVLSFPDDPMWHDALVGVSFLRRRDPQPG